MRCARVVTLAVVVTLCACSSETVGTGNQSTVPSAPVSPVEATGPPDFGLPEVDAAVIARTNVALAEPSTAGWIVAALGVKDLDAAEVCRAVPPTMDAVVAGNVVLLEDGVIAELLVDLDSALGGIELACGARDSGTVDTELADALAAAGAIEARLAELRQ